MVKVRRYHCTVGGDPVPVLANTSTSVIFLILGAGLFGYFVLKACRQNI